MLMIPARLVRSESFWAVVKVRSRHTGPEFGYLDTLESVGLRRAIATNSHKNEKCAPRDLDRRRSF